MRWLPILLAITATALPPASRGADAPADERTAAWQQFRGAFDQGDYQAALPLAARVVELTTSQYGAEAPEMANALSNLATTYYRLQDYGKALDTYRSALTVLELAGNATDARLIRPLHGMGAVLHALHRDDEAVTPLKRAVDITRNRDGLHAESQLPILKALIASYVESGRLEDAGREQQYAFSVAEAAYGRDDLRLLPALADYAEWYELTARFTAARLLHARAVQIADAAQPGNIAAVPALRGIARCFRLAFIYGETDESLATANEVPNALGTSALTQLMAAPSTEGERALRNAVQRLGTGADNAKVRGEVLVDLGDWYRTADKEARAVETWRLAWKQLAAANDTALLARPHLVVYRKPAVALARHDEDYSGQDVELHLAIDADGDLREATVANPAPEREAAERSVISAVRRGTWRPAFADGEPVAMNDYLFRERVYVKATGS